MGVSRKASILFEAGGGRKKDGLVLNPPAWFVSQPEAVCLDLQNSPVSCRKEWRIHVP
jgi:hypothetical protein